MDNSLFLFRIKIFIFGIIMLNDIFEIWLFLNEIFFKWEDNGDIILLMLLIIILLLKKICFRDVLFRNRKKFLNKVFKCIFVKWIFFNELFCNLKKVLCNFLEWSVLFLFKFRYCRWGSIWKVSLLMLKIWLCFNLSFVKYSLEIFLNVFFFMYFC